MMCIIAIVALPLSLPLSLTLLHLQKIRLSMAVGKAKEQCCRQQNINYVIVALTAHYGTNCSQFFIHNESMMKPCMIPMAMHDGMTRLAFSCLNNSSVLIQVIS